MHEELEHAAGFPTDPRGKRILVLFRQYQRLEVEIESVAVVVRRKLSVHSIIQKLFLGFFLQNSLARRQPDRWPLSILKNEARNE